MGILVVDDSKAMRMIVVRELRKAGYDADCIVEAENGGAALDQIDAGGVELVLSDWNMPDMSGIDLLAALRRDGNKVPFGFITSESAGETRRRAFEVGADFVVVKPFRGDDLARRVDLALGGSDDTDVDRVPRRTGELTVARVLTELLGRAVVTVSSDPPGRETPRALARYVTTPGGKIFVCVAQIGAAASLGAALSRIPGREAEQWQNTFALPEAIEQNFHEVANVLAKLVIPPGSGERCVLDGVSIIPDLEDPPELKGLGPDAWRVAFEVRIDGYPPGLVGFAALGTARRW